jgi:glycosyltransferase involved in cell wall biosynthesis
MPDSDPPKSISIIIPVYNEVESLTELYNQIISAVKTLPLEVEIWFIDDGSTDSSWVKVEGLARIDPRVSGVRFRRNFGKASALQAGFERATGDVVFTMDADLQDDPQEIPHFLETLATGFDVVSGWKQVRNDPIYKVFPSRVFNAMVSRVTGVKLHDHNCGFKVYRQPVVKTVRLYGELHRFVPVLAAAQGFRIGEMIVQHRARKFGHSKFGAKRYLKGFLDMLGVKFTTTFGERPLHAFGALAVGSLGFAFGLGLIGIVMLLLNYLFLATAALLIAVAFGLFAGQAMMTGLIAELLVQRTILDDSTTRISQTISGPGVP